MTVDDQHIYVKPDSEVGYLRSFLRSELPHNSLLAC